MGGLVCAVHRRKNKGFPTLKRTLNLGIEKGRLLKNSRPKGGLIQVICYPASPETVDITGFFEKFCIAIRTISSIHKGFDFMNTRFFYSDTVCCREQAVACSFSLCCFRLCEVFDGDSLAGIRFVMRMPRRSRDLHIANKAVITIRWVRFLPVPSVSNTSMWSISSRSSGAVR